MYVSDQLFYCIWLALALIFSMAQFFSVPTSIHVSVKGSLSDDNAESEALVRFGRIVAKTRFFLFGMLAGTFWFILGVLTSYANNCLSAFNETCFTSPTFASTTGTATPFTYGIVAGYGFGILGIIWYCLTVFLAIAMIYSDSVSQSKEAERVSGVRELKEFQE